MVTFIRPVVGTEKHCVHTANFAARKSYHSIDFGAFSAILGVVFVLEHSECSKELAHSKNLFSNEQKRRGTSAHLVDEPCSKEPQAQTGRPVSAPSPKNLKNRYRFSLLASHMPHLSYSLFRLPVPTSRKPLIW
jgi:hypothetical protein